MAQFQPAQGFQPAAGGFGLQMPQIGFQPLQQPAFQPALQPLQFGGGFEPTQSQMYAAQPSADPTTFTIGIPGGFQFVPDAAKSPVSAAGSPMAAASGSPMYQREGTGGLRTRDAGLAQKKPKKKSCCPCC